MSNSTFFFNSLPSYDSFVQLVSERTGAYPFSRHELNKGYLEACKIQRAIDYRKNKLVLTLAEQGFLFDAGDDGDESYCFVSLPSGQCVGVITEEGDFLPG